MNSLRKKGPGKVRLRINEPAILSSRFVLLAMNGLRLKERKSCGFGSTNQPSHNHSWAA